MRTPMACCDSISREEQISRVSLKRTSTRSLCGSINARGKPWDSKLLPIDYKRCCSDQLNPPPIADIRELIRARNRKTASRRSLRNSVRAVVTAQIGNSDQRERCCQSFDWNKSLYRRTLCSQVRTLFRSAGLSHSQSRDQRKGIRSSTSTCLLKRLPHQHPKPSQAEFLRRSRTGRSKKDIPPRSCYCP